MNYLVMRGPDPRIHLFGKVDCRVKPGNDGVYDAAGDLI